MKWPTHAVQSTWDSPLGPINLCATPQGLAGLWFHDQRHRPDGKWFQHWAIDNQQPVLLETQRQLRAFFDGALKRFDLPLDLMAGTLFQRDVWAALQGIPGGDTRSYGEVAHQVGRAAAVRAVGAAVGRNPISIVVPCHRVVGANGALTGYAGGLDRKTALLQLEGAAVWRNTNASMPASNVNSPNA
ncbi:cysteine methyltransferase [Hydrogenophaga crassostreae]|uniref:Methylated-DNA--protein-cysteine methyltransferase n=1 Tax=Hydrogenophaga crassostreae TaxID=1763535 RepID=A0A167IAS3_9BURK|nr:methylated-DNA--[protein]-cysteine S-methyltransferase [Hydrogenophaga crassostreae]AOW12390.1 cysteine methyltransferase [Hydrogenophaga crassostreae]OAD42441.1 cysteine methyltransferase [Hydrogenophaga crassostreae]